MEKKKQSIEANMEEGVLSVFFHSFFFFFCFNFFLDQTWGRKQNEEVDVVDVVIWVNLTGREQKKSRSKINSSSVEWSQNKYRGFKSNGEVYHVLAEESSKSWKSFEELWENVGRISKESRRIAKESWKIFLEVA